MRKSSGFVIWLTGLSGSGKSTIAGKLAPALLSRGMQVEVLDGDEVRENLSKGLGFSREDRDINVLRIGYVAKLLARNNVAVIVAAISPYRETRSLAGKGIENFFEAFVNCSVEECSKRDVKGLYRKANNGEIPKFTGVSDPYEAPENPAIRLNTSEETIEQSVEKILDLLESRELLNNGKNSGYSPQEEAEIKSRLGDLGYM